VSRPLPHHRILLQSSANPQESFEVCDKQETDECFTQRHDYIEPPHKVPERCPICVEFEEGLKKGINGFGRPDRLGGGVR